MKNIFHPETLESLVSRINRLTAASNPLWGKMSINEMLAHCNVIYELVYDQRHPRPNSFKRFILKTFWKGTVVSEKPYKRGIPTSPVFLIKDQRDFEQEKQRLVKHLWQTQELGEEHFDGKESHSFGQLTSEEWNNMFYKHLDHHLQQFGV